MYGDNAPPSWARLPGARCRAVEHLTKLEGLQEFEVLEGLDEEFFQALSIAAAVLEIGDGTALYREGEPSGAVYFVREGRVKLYRSSGGPKARDQILSVVGDGAVIGLSSAPGRPAPEPGRDRPDRLHPLRRFPRRPVGDSGPLPGRLDPPGPQPRHPQPRAGRPRGRPGIPQRPPKGGPDAPGPRHRRRPRKPRRRRLRGRRSRARRWPKPPASPAKPSPAPSPGWPAKASWTSTTKPSPCSNPPNFAPAPDPHLSFSWERLAIRTVFDLDHIRP